MSLFYSIALGFKEIMIKLSEIKKRNKINVCSVRTEECGDGTCDNNVKTSRVLLLQDGDQDFALDKKTNT